MATIFDDNSRHAAELAKLKAETELLEAQNAKARAENEFKMRVEVEKMIAETRKIERETRWVPLTALSAIVAGFLAVVVAVIFKVIHG